MKSRNPLGWVVALLGVMLCVEAYPDEVAMKGERVCLQRKPEPDGRILLDCAIGFRGDDEKFYGLRAADPRLRDPFAPLNRRVRVRGNLVPSLTDRYEDSGDIEYTSIESITDPRPLTGVFLCMKHDVPNMPRADTCKSVIKSDRGLYWGLDPRSLEALGVSRDLKQRDRISLEADILEEATEDWAAWTSLWAPHRIQAILRVRTLQKKPAQ